MSESHRETWLTTDEMAEWVKVASWTVRDWRKRKVGPKAHVIGGSVRYALSDIEAWIAQSNGSTPPKAG